MHVYFLLTTVAFGFAMDCQLRGVWIFKVPSSTSNSKPWSDKNVLFTRKFPTGEKRAKHVLGSDYVPIPPISQMGPVILSEVGLAVSDAHQFNPSRDTCGKPISDPVYRIETRDGSLWPFIATDKSGYLFCCLPVVPSVSDEDSTTDPSPVNCLSVAGGFSLLTALVDFISVPKAEVFSRMSSLPAFINEAAPFGVVRDGNAENIQARLNNKPCVVPKSSKIPAWKAFAHKGKASLHLSVVERIKASQCAQDTWQDTQEVYGTITCKAELEGSSSDVSVSIVHTGEGLRVPLDGLTVHSCVQRADWMKLENTKESRLAPRRLRFCPPTDQFTLCQYTVGQLNEAPIFGVYEMKPEDTKVSLRALLKLSDQVKNNFELCELHIPFHTRSPITQVDGNPTQGTLSLSQSRKVIIWNIGQKFTSKDQKVHLNATVTFGGTEQGLPAPTVEDAFCRGNNSYAQLYFKILDFTHSGCHIDAKSIQVSPATKYKVSLNREYSSSDYKIWNSAGEGLTTNNSKDSASTT